jgi:hypothetical protein
MHLLMLHMQLISDQYWSRPRTILKISEDVEMKMYCIAAGMYGTSSYDHHFPMTAIYESQHYSPGTFKLLFLHVQAFIWWR